MTGVKCFLVRRALNRIPISKAKERENILVVIHGFAGCPIRDFQVRGRNGVSSGLG